MDILIKVLQFILSFSLLVIIHELGHFLFARIFGVRVEQFQLFFGRPIASFTRRGTRYGIGWIPFGGYVKLAGMIDESMDTEQMKSEPKPDEFRSKPAWQRLLIMVGGVLMNILLALVIYIGISWKWGESYLSTRDMTYGYVFSPQGEEMGFRDGDRILSVNGETYDDFRQLRIALLLEQNYTVEVLRNGDTVTFRTPVVSVNDLAQDAGFISPRYPFLIGQGSKEAVRPRPDCSRATASSNSTENRSPISTNTPNGSRSSAAPWPKSASSATVRAHRSSDISRYAYPTTAE